MQFIESKEIQESHIADNSPKKSKKTLQNISQIVVNASVIASDPKMIELLKQIEDRATMTTRQSDATMSIRKYTLWDFMQLEQR